MQSAHMPELRDQEHFANYQNMKFEYYNYKEIFSKQDIAGLAQIGTRALK